MKKETNEKSKFVLTLQDLKNRSKTGYFGFELGGCSECKTTFRSSETTRNERTKDTRSERNSHESGRKESSGHSEYAFRFVRLFQSQLQKTKPSASMQPLKKHHWFEKFYWFITTENYLVISGRDARQNELLVKKYMKYFLILSKACPIERQKRRCLRSCRSSRSVLDHCEKLQTRQAVLERRWSSCVT